MALQIQERLREEGDALPAIHAFSHRLPSYAAILLILQVYTLRRHVIS